LVTSPIPWLISRLVSQPRRLIAISDSGVAVAEGGVGVAEGVGVSVAGSADEVRVAVGVFGVKDSVVGKVASVVSVSVGVQVSGATYAVTKMGVPVGGRVG
jgi:hypothetical protein